jgi:hypothetical protein
VRSWRWQCDMIGVRQVVFPQTKTSWEMVADNAQPRRLHVTAKRVRLTKLVAAFAHNDRSGPLLRPRPVAINALQELVSTVCAVLLCERRGGESRWLL